jgi:hypothetical protein
MHSPTRQFSPFLYLALKVLSRRVDTLVLERKALTHKGRDDMEAVTFTNTAVFAAIVGIGPVIVGMLRAHKGTVVGKR